MLMKDVSFWCVVLAIVIIFVVHHILSSFKDVEGLENEEETPPLVNQGQNADTEPETEPEPVTGSETEQETIEEGDSIDVTNNQVSFELDIENYPDDQSGDDEPITDTGAEETPSQPLTPPLTPPLTQTLTQPSQTLTQTLTQPPSVPPAQSPEAEPLVESEEIGAPIMSPEEQLALSRQELLLADEAFKLAGATARAEDELNILHKLRMEKLLKGDTAETKASTTTTTTTTTTSPSAQTDSQTDSQTDTGVEEAVEEPTTTTTTTTPQPTGIQPVVQGAYHYYPGLLEFEGVGPSTLACNNDVPLTVGDAKNECNTTEDCSGFFHFDTSQSAKTCFKKDVDISRPQKPMDSVMKNDNPNGGFYVVHGEKPEIIEPMWVLGQTNQDCNEVCSAKGEDLKCLSGNWKMSKDEYKQALFDGGLKDEDSVNTVDDIEEWCGKIGGSTSPTRPGTGNTPTNETQCFYTDNTTTDCESKHVISRRLCRCGIE